MGYHLNIKFVSRGKGQSLVAKGAYDARAKFREERTGELKDYSYKADAPVKSFVFVDKKHGAGLQNVETLLNAIDRSEIDANAQTGLSLIASLPKLLTDEDRARIVRDFGREEFLRQNIPAVAHIHGPHEHDHEKEHSEEEELSNNGNHHVHFKIGLRTLGPDGQFGEKYLEWGSYREFLEHKRERWAELGARYLEKAQYLDKDVREREAERWRYGHLKQEQQHEKALERGDREWAEKKSKEAGKHRGPNADAMERKGIETDLGNASRDVEQRNEERAEISAEIQSKKHTLAKLERQDAFDKLKDELTEAENLLRDRHRAEREYAQRDPVREQIAWEDKVAAAAIDKEKKDRQFLEKPLSGRTGVEQEKHEPARPRFGDVLITRAAKAAMSDPRQQHGGPVNPAAFKDALEKNRFGLACVTPEEAAKSHGENKFAKEVGRYAPVYQAGEIVIVREPRPDGNTGGRVHKLDQTKAEDYLRCMALDKNQLQGIEATRRSLQLGAFYARQKWTQRGGLYQQQMWALRSAKQRTWDIQRTARSQQSPRQREEEYAERQKCNSGEIDPERYRSDPDYRREAQNSQGYKTPQEKKRDRENDVRAIMEQQDRGGRG